MTERQEKSETPYGRLIREAKEAAFLSRRRLRKEQPAPSNEAKRATAEAIADYYDVLRDYSDERALETPWDERFDVDPDSLLDETVQVAGSVNSRNGNAAELTTVPAAAALGARELIDISKELDAIAKELGFAAEAKQPTPNTEASKDDLMGILRARGQDQALENFPESWREGVE